MEDEGGATDEGREASRASACWRSRATPSRPSSALARVLETVRLTMMRAIFDDAGRTRARVGDFTRR